MTLGEEFRQNLFNVFYWLSFISDSEELEPDLQVCIQCHNFPSTVCNTLNKELN